MVCIQVHRQCLTGEFRLEQGPIRQTEPGDAVVQSGNGVIPESALRPPAMGHLVWTAWSIAVAPEGRHGSQRGEWLVRNCGAMLSAEKPAGRVDSASSQLFR